jgi:hypothetical protein
MKPMRLTHLPKVLIISCGALAREVLAVLDVNGWRHMELTCLPADWHFTPKKIPDGMRQKIRENRSAYDEILCVFGDCGTAGELDRVLEQEGVERIGGDHCYAFYAGLDEYAAIDEREPGTLYLTDFFVRFFDSFVTRYLGLDDHPELRDDYFVNFTRVLYLSQTSDGDLDQKAAAAAKRIGLKLEIVRTGLDNIDRFLVKSIARANPTSSL